MIECQSCRRQAPTYPYMIRGMCPHCGVTYTPAAMRAATIDPPVLEERK